MAEKTIAIDIPLLVPDIEDVRDSCLARLEASLRGKKGILGGHINHDAEPPQLCLHYDPSLISLNAVQRIARETGSDFTDRYRHEAIPFTGMDAADAATSLAQTLENLPGMLHANVSYAAGLAFAAYDSERLKRQAVLEAIRTAGYKPLVGDEPSAVAPPSLTEQEVEEHELLPGFLLPQWVQERWRLILVTLAGIFFMVGWLGSLFFGLPTEAATFFFVLSYIAGGYDIATHAIPSLLQGQFDTDVLMLAAAAGAAVLGEWAEGAFLLFLFSLGHVGEHYALDRARNAINELGKLMPKTAQVKRGDELIERPVEEVKPGDTVVVRPGDRIPVDGEVVSGTSAVDQSAITGESVPVSKDVGDDVFAGTINQENALEVAATKLPEDTTLSRVIQMVTEAQGQQSPTQQFTQRFTAKFVPAVLVLVVLVIIIPPALGLAGWQDSLYRGMLLLVAASPCALAIGTPAAVLAGIGQAARYGVLIKGGVHLENLGNLKVMAFDKTGTLTEGLFEVTDVTALNGTSTDELLRIAAAVEQSSNHPLAMAVVKAAQERDLELPAAEGLQNVAGKGVKSAIEGTPVLIGTLRLFEEVDFQASDEQLDSLVARYEAEGKTTMAVSHGSRFVGVLALADKPRPGIRETMQQLLELGIEKLVMLTGDNEAVARLIGRVAGVTDVRAELLPEDKVSAVRELEQAYGDIAMTGDGINDAPAMATATVGIAMGGMGTAVALETADIALMADNLAQLPFAVGLSRASRGIIKQNLFISLGVIGLLLATSVLGLIQLSGTVILHEGSTLLVVLNALRLLRYKQG